MLLRLRSPDRPEEIPVYAQTGHTIYDLKILLEEHGAYFLLPLPRQNLMLRLHWIST